MTERGSFDKSLREEVKTLRSAIYTVWPKLDEAGLSGQSTFQEALKKHPQLQQQYSEGRPIVRAISSLADEGESSNSGISVTLYRPGEQGLSPEAPRINIELYESGIGMIEEYDMGGGVETIPRRGIMPTRNIEKEDMPMIQAATLLIGIIANSV